MVVCFSNFLEELNKVCLVEDKKSIINLHFWLFILQNFYLCFRPLQLALSDETWIFLGRFSAWINPKEQTAQVWARFASLQLTQKSLYIQRLHLFSWHSTEHTAGTILSHDKTFNIELKLLWTEENISKLLEFYVGVTKKAPVKFPCFEFKHFSKKVTRPKQEDCKSAHTIWSRAKVTPYLSPV